MEDEENQQDEEEEMDIDDNEYQEDDTQDVSLKELFEMPTLERTTQNPELILKNPDMKQRFEASEQIHDYFHKKADKPPVHPGFVSTYSFGEHEFERLKFLLFRLDEVAEKVISYRKDGMQYLPEFYSTLYNLFININYIIDSTNRKRIEDGFRYVREAVIEYTTNQEMNPMAIQILCEIYLELMNIKNFHGLGFSYEKKRGESEKYQEAFFKRRPR